MEISVVIPVYNTEQYLAECLNTLIAQQFEDWECLLIDDGSSDRSGSICDRYAKQDRRFRVFHTANAGVSAARNLGIKHALGTYIAFIDSDDTVDNQYLYGLYKAMKRGESQLVVCGMKLVYPSGIKINTATERLVVIGKKDADNFVELNQKFLLYGPVVKLYHSDIIQQNKILFPLNIQYGEDLIFNLKYLEYVTAIYVISPALYNYRILGSGTLSSTHNCNFKNNYGQWKIIRSFFDKKGIDTPNAQIYLSNRLWGIVYDFVMSDKMSIKEIRSFFNMELMNDLKSFNAHTIAIPFWLKIIISNRLHRLIWLIQRGLK